MRISLVSMPEHGPDVDALAALLSSTGHVVRGSTPADRDQLLQDPGDLIVAAGGDGTVRRVALLAAEAGIPFAALPIGTANNIGKALGVIGDARELIGTWSSQPRPEIALDLGEIDGPWGRRRFVEGVGGGVVAELIHRGAEVEDPAVLLGRETDRALHLLDELVSEAPPRSWQIRADGTDRSGSYLAVEVLNVRFIGPNVPFARDADAADGALDVVLVGDSARAPIRRYVEDRLRLASGTPPPLPTVRASRIELEAPAGVRLRIDDETWPVDGPLQEPARLSVRCLPGAVTMVGPGGKP